MRHLIIIIMTVISCAAFGQVKTAKEYYDLGDEAYQKGDYKTAVEYIDKAIEAEPSNLDYLLVKASVYLDMKEYGKALETYSDGVRLFPKNPDVYGERAKLLERMQQFELSSDDYEVALGLCTNDSTKYYLLTNRATLKMSTRNFQGAYDDLIQSYAWDSTNLATLTNLGAVCDEIDRPEETLKFLLKAVEIDSTYYPAYGNIGYKYQEMGQHEKAIEYYNIVLEISPDNPVALSNRSFNRLQLGDIEEAMADINLSIKLYPENSFAYKNRALVYIEMNKKGKACNDLETAIELGFTEMYGKEVQKLQKEHCGK